MRNFEDLSQEEQEKIKADVREWAWINENADWDYNLYVEDREWWNKFHNN